MGRLTTRLVQSAYKVSVGRNEYNDVQYGPAGAAIPCMYRDISITQQSGNSEQKTLDGQLWFDNDYVPQEGEVYLLETQYLRIERVIVSRARLTDNHIDYYKCEVSKQRQVS